MTCAFLTQPLLLRPSHRRNYASPLRPCLPFLPPLHRIVCRNAGPRRTPPSASSGRSSQSKSPSLPVSLALLNLTTVLWGTQHAVIKLAVTDIDPSTLNLSRFLLAALISLPALPGLPTSPRAFFKTPLFRHASELSLYLFAGYALQSAALLTTSASRSAFLLYLNVKFVPLLARLVYARPIPALTWASAALALGGTLLLTYDGSPPAVGDAFSVAAALASALFILRTERACSAPGVTPAALNAATLAGVSVLCGAWALGSYALGLGGNGAASLTSWEGGLASVVATLAASPSTVAAVIYLATVPTALCNYVQAWAQRGVTAERAAVVFALDPVYGALFAWLLLGETLGAQGVAGAATIVVAAVLSAVGDGGSKRKDEASTAAGLSGVAEGDKKARVVAVEDEGVGSASSLVGRAGGTPTQGSQRSTSRTSRSE